MEELNKTTAKDFRQFQFACRKWINKLGLQHWSVEIRHELSPGKYATCAYNVVELQAAITLSTEFPMKPTAWQLHRLALHECLHLVVAPLHALAAGRSARDTEICMADHVIVHTLENLLMPAVEEPA